MDDVIENCQVTFEEDGVNQQTLDELRKVGLFSLVSLVASSRHDLRHFGLAMMNVEAFCSCAWKAIEISTLLNLEFVEDKGAFC